MSTIDAFTKIRDHLTTMWTTTPLSWENEAFTTPADADGNDLPFVHVQVIGDIFDQQSIGAGSRLANRWEEEGDLLLTVIVPEGTGAVLARTYATQLADIYRGLQLSDIEFRDVSIGLGVAAEDRGPWWALPVRINWTKG